MPNYLLRRSGKNVIDGAYLPLSMGGELQLGNPEKTKCFKEKKMRANEKFKVEKHECVYCKYQV